MQTTSGRPKDLEKRARILQAAKSIFLKMGYHATSMDQIAKEAGVTKLTVYNHFQDKANLFTCAIEESCEESIRAKQFELTAESDFRQTLYLMCQRALSIIYLPEALMLGTRHHKVLLGLDSVPTTVEIEQMIEQAIELFLLKYQPKF